MPVRRHNAKLDTAVSRKWDQWQHDSGRRRVFLYRIISISCKGDYDYSSRGGRAVRGLRSDLVLALIQRLTAGLWIHAFRRDEIEWSRMCELYDPDWYCYFWSKNTNITHSYTNAALHRHTVRRVTYTWYYGVYPLDNGNVRRLYCPHKRQR